VAGLLNLSVQRMKKMFRCWQNQDSRLLDLTSPEK
jgi:hypothetical protein